MNNFDIAIGIESVVGDFCGTCCGLGKLIDKRVHVRFINVERRMVVVLEGLGEE